MKLTSQDLRLQAWLLILFLCGMFVGGLELLTNIFPIMRLPESIRLSAEGAIAVLAGSGAMTAIFFKKPQWRLIFGLTLLGLAGYTLGHNWLAGNEDSGLSLLTGQLRLENPPAIIVLILSGVALLGLTSPLGRLFAFLSGSTGIAVGGYTVSAHLHQGVAGELGGLVGGFSLLAGLFCFAFGIALLILSQRDQEKPFLLKRDSLLVGAIGILGTFILSLIASWGAHEERHQAAATALQYHSHKLEYELNDSVAVINRLANRWAALNFNIPVILEQTETRLYFKDIPALESLMLFREGSSLQWRRSRGSESLLWVMDQTVTPNVLRWIREARENRQVSSWIFPDPTRPFTGVAFIRPSVDDSAYFLAVFNVASLLDLAKNVNYQDFKIGLYHTDNPMVERAIANHHAEFDVFEHLRINVPNGPEMVLTATAGAESFLTLRGILPSALFSFGVFISYLLIIGRSLLTIQKEQAREITTAEQRFRSLFTQSPNAVFAFDRHGIYQAVNPVAQRIVGVTNADIGVTHYWDVITPETTNDEDVSLFNNAFLNAVAGHPQHLEITFQTASTGTRIFDMSFVPTVVDAQIVGVFALAKDVTEQYQALEKQRILQRSLESSDNAVIVVDTREESLPVVFANPAFTSMTGYTREEVIGSPVKLLVGPETNPTDIESIRDTVKAGQTSTTTLKSYCKDGTPFWNHVSLAPVRDDKQRVTHYAAIMTDISEKKEQDNRLAYQATHDVLTGLANRSLMEDRLKHDFALARRNNQHLAVLFIDLDEFKPINDTLGHKIGDALLISVARKLESITRPEDTLARFGGDEFVLLLPDLGSPCHANDVAERILNVIAAPHQVGAHELYISASIGISLLHEYVEEPEKLIQQADMAMYKAKQQGRDTYEVYSEDLDSKLSKRVALRNELQEAIKSNQLFLCYQPQVDQNGDICGLEALVRWKHPAKGFISPADFIPIAEETGQIAHLGKWVTTQACKDAKRLLEMGMLTGRMAVNLSPLQFHRPGFLTTLRGILDETQLAPEHLELELTEGILMKDSEGAIDILDALNGMGIATAIDDFGTGYSSFSYLKDLPVDNIKIDRSFVDNVTTNEKDAAVCKGVITLAREMGLHVVAEGVETEEQFSYLKSHGCEAFQGYYFAKPMEFDNLVHWIRSVK